MSRALQVFIRGRRVYQHAADSIVASVRRSAARDEALFPQMGGCEYILDGSSGGQLKSRAPNRQPVRLIRCPPRSMFAQKARLVDRVREA